MSEFPEPRTFGQVVSDQRRRLAMSQKQLAISILKEDGLPISPQYLNDIERDRRLPSPHVVQEIARVLALDPVWLSFLAGQVPLDFREDAAADPERFRSALRAYRRRYSEERDG
jgi:transcriptional regulator with XRE-family HTH domain